MCSDEEYEKIKRRRSNSAVDMARKIRVYEREIVKISEDTERQMRAILF